MLRKKFAFFQPHHNEEIKKLKVCEKIRKGKFVGPIPPTDLCSICRVFLMSDRFLGEEFHRRMGIRISLPDSFEATQRLGEFIAAERPWSTHIKLIGRG